MKKMMVVDFSNIFSFALKEYGIHWNPCNDLFFKHCLSYRSCNEFHVEEITEMGIPDWDCMNPDYDESNVAVWSGMTVDEVNQLEPKAKAYVIIGMFMLTHNLKEMLVTSV